MFLASEAREIAKLYVEPKINIEDIMEIIYKEVFNSAIRGKYSMRVTIDPRFAREAKSRLKERVSTVSIFHSDCFDYRNGPTTASFTGDIEISWK